VSEEIDWRLETGEEAWMHGARLRWARYKQPTADWDHDHCALCGAKFMDRDEVDVLREGYVFQPDSDPTVLSEPQRTSFHDGQRIVSAPTGNEWICATCFSDFEAHFGWTGQQA